MEENQISQNNKSEDGTKTLLERMVDFSYQKFLGRMRVAQKKRKMYEEELEEIDKQRKIAIIKSFLDKNS